MTVDLSACSRTTAWCDLWTCDIFFIGMEVCTEKSLHLNVQEVPSVHSFLIIVLLVVYTMHLHCSANALCSAQFLCFKQEWICQAPHTIVWQRSVHIQIQLLRDRKASLRKTQCEQPPSDPRRIYEGNIFYQDDLRQTHTQTHMEILHPHFSQSKAEHPPRNTRYDTVNWKIKNKRKPVVFHVVEVWKHS